MLRFLFSIIPDDWISAWRSFRQMLSIVFYTRRAIAKQAVGLLLPLGAGIALSMKVGSLLSVDFMQGYITVLGVLFGFVVALMLFTGGIEGTQILTHIQAKRYAEKIRYLLASQTITLGVYLIAIIVGACWLFSNKAGTGAKAFFYIAPFVFGTGAMALLRTILLPAQIYERHDFVMASLVEEKQKTYNELLAKAREGLARQEVRSSLTI
jgi:hypothetical protein